MAQKGPNFELLKDAYQIIGGIPARAIDLDDIITRRGDSLGCGTVACAAGWLAMHPHFQAQGLDLYGGALAMNGVVMPYEDAMSKLFNIGWLDARKLFGASRLDGSDKHEWLGRVQNYLREHGQLKEQLQQKETQ